MVGILNYWVFFFNGHCQEMGGSRSGTRVLFFIHGRYYENVWGGSSSFVVVVVSFAIFFSSFFLVVLLFTFSPLKESAHCGFLGGF